jgi:outer membrane protein insertion porin family/translocation and assembly module TamA
MAQLDDARILQSGGGRLAFALLSAVAVFAGVGCAHRPPGRYVVDRVDFERMTVPGLDVEDTGPGVPDSALEDKIATAASPHFLGIFPSGVVLDYELFDPHVLERDLARIQRVYRARGYYEAEARAGRVEKTGEGHVRVTIVVREGRVVNVGEIRIEGVATRPLDDSAALFPALRRLLRTGRAFDEDNFDEAKGRLVRTLEDRGYAFAKVKGAADVDLARHLADVTFTVDTGVPARLGAITITGLDNLPEEPVRRALDLAEGEPYSASKLESARKAVLALGVFGDAEVTPNLGASDSGVVPVNVHLSPSDLHEVKLGGGIELDTLRAEWHVLTGWEDRNFLGGLRHLTLDFKPGAVLYPTRIPTFALPKSYLLEGRAHAELRQPGFLEARTQGVVQGQFNMYPVIFPPNAQTPLTDWAPGIWVLGYRDLGTSFGLEREFGPLKASIDYNLQTNFPFAYLYQPGFPYASIGSVPVENGQDEFKKVVLSFVDLKTALDLRDDPLKPHKGFFASVDFQVAGVPVTPNFRSDDPLFPHDLRVQPEVRGYIPFKWKRATLAMRLTTGFLFPSGYAQSFEDTTQSIKPDDAQLVFFRGFFSGGPNSNRGYALRGVGSKGPIPFYINGISPATTAAATATLCKEPLYANSLGCNFPTGGLTLWETSVELRVPIAFDGDLTAAFFCDASDVSRKQVDIRLLYPHLSCGLGAHYNTPVGPIRLDVGFPIPGLQVLDPNATPADKALDNHYAVSIGVGEAF